MPLIEVDLDKALYDEKHEQISAEIHQAQIAALDIPPDDLFQVFRPHGLGEIKFDRTYGGVDRQRLVVIRITMVHRYSVALKRSLYKHIVERLAEVGIRPEDIQIAIVENGFEDWYAGKL
jgi:phenylpyruvate tautomerase PptA (4-oxalocrotonate tautomerase family)